MPKELALRASHRIPTPVQFRAEYTRLYPPTKSPNSLQKLLVEIRVCGYFPFLGASNGFPFSKSRSNATSASIPVFIAGSTSGANSAE